MQHTHEVVRPQPFSDSRTFLSSEGRPRSHQQPLPTPGLGMRAATGFPGCPTAEPGCGRCLRRTFWLPSLLLAGLLRQGGCWLGGGGGLFRAALVPVPSGSETLTDESQGCPDLGKDCVQLCRSSWWWGPRHGL